MDVDDPREIEALRREVELAAAALERVDRELASLEANLVNLGRYRRSIMRERLELLERLTSLRRLTPRPAEPASGPPPRRSPRLAKPIWVHATEEQAIVFDAGRALRRRLGDLD